MWKKPIVIEGTEIEISPDPEAIVELLEKIIGQSATIVRTNEKIVETSLRFLAVPFVKAKGQLSEEAYERISKMILAEWKGENDEDNHDSMG